MNDLIVYLALSFFRIPHWLDGVSWRDVAAAVAVFSFASLYLVTLIAFLCHLTPGRERAP